MSKSIEVIHTNFEKKISILESIIFDLELPCEIRANKLLNMESIKKSYTEDIVPILCEYYMQDGLSERCLVVDKYNQVFVSKNHLAHLDTLKDYLKSHDLKGKCASGFVRYDNILCDVTIPKNDYKVCPLCYSKMAIFPHQSENRCTECAYVIILKGTVFDESQIHNHDGSASKRGSYEESRHCKYHLDRILGVKTTELSDDFDKKVNEWCKKRDKQARHLNCEDWRRLLKDIGETQYNEYIPYIMQKYGGLEPGYLYYHEKTLVCIRFDKVVRANDQLKDSENNMKYYPFYIMKIIEDMLWGVANSKRRQNIINGIHLQRENTVIANLKRWEKICEITGITFRKTNINTIHSS